MAKKKEAGAAKKKTVKAVGSVRVRSRRDAEPYYSGRDTPPINVLDTRAMIAEGIHPPLQYQCKVVTNDAGESRQVGRFEKTAKEREIWKKEHSHKKGQTGGLPVPRHREIQHTLVVHLFNAERDKHFVTTRSFQVKPSEVKSIIDRYHYPNSNRRVVKYHYRGNTLHVK